MRKLFLFSVIFYFSLVCISYGQWSPVNGPYGGSITSLAVVGSNIITGTENGGVFISSDNGASWSVRNNGLVNLKITSIVVSGGYVFAGTKDTGIFRSSNNGLNWMSVNSGLDNKIITSLSVSGSLIYAGTYSGVYVSSNNGTNWSLLGLSGSYINCLYASGSNLFIGTSGQGIFLTSDNGTTWLPAGNYQVFSIVASGNTIFANTSAQVLKSSNNGISWSSVSSGINMNSYLTTLFVSGSYLFLGSLEGAGLYKMSITGNTWSAINSGFSHFQIGEMVLLNGYLIAGSAEVGGIFISTNNGVNWSQSNYGLRGLEITCVVSKGSLLFAGTSKGVQLSTNNGASWSFAGGEMYESRIVAMAVLDQYVYASNKSGNSSYVYRSSNNGINWSLVSNQGISSGISCFAVVGSIIYAGGIGVFKSTNYGASWTASGLTNVSVNSLAVSGAYLFAATFNSGVYRGSINGTNWSTVNSGLPTSISMVSIAGSGSYIYVASSYQDFYVSTNYGTNWEQSFSGSNYIATIPIITYQSDVFVGFGDNPNIHGIYQSTNHGSSFLEKNQGFVVAPFINNFAFANNYLFVCTNGQSLWRSDSLFVGVKNTNTFLPNVYSLSQNYPNPFNPSTGIKFDIPKTAIVSISIFDISGKEIDVILCERLEAGSYLVNWNASSFSSGVYFYKITSDNYSETKKMILIK